MLSNSNHQLVVENRVKSLKTSFSIQAADCSKKQ
ncbi:unnamed protein product [Brugia timori]|uniref:Transposase n=1 Tax=Brugia timori TaxID=42155 RepID=A0A0R3R4Z5_9BILA|nr:unnamed protein product [Brugia timori]